MERIMAILGIDHKGNWNPSQYVIDAGWNWDCIEQTAKKGIAEDDAIGLTPTQQADLLDFCKWRVEQVKLWQSAS